MPHHSLSVSYCLNGFAPLPSGLSVRSSRYQTDTPRTRAALTNASVDSRLPFALFSSPLSQRLSVDSPTFMVMANCLSVRPLAPIAFRMFSCLGAMRLGSRTPISSRL